MNLLVSIIRKNSYGLCLWLSIFIIGKEMVLSALSVATYFPSTEAHTFCLETLAVSDCETLLRDCESLEENFAWECSQIKLCCRAVEAGNKTKDRLEIKKKEYRNERRTKANPSYERNGKGVNIIQDQSCICRRRLFYDGIRRYSRRRRYPCRKGAHCDCCEQKSRKNCGIPMRSSRILGGSEVSANSIPWQVGIAEPGNPRPKCGGTLISSKHVLSAAHCFDSTQQFYMSVFEIIVEEHYVHSRNDGIRHKVCSYTAHPEYYWEYIEYEEERWDWRRIFSSSIRRGIEVYFNDFAVIRMRVPVRLGIRAVPACLPDPSLKDEKLDGELLTVSGWGRLKEGGKTPDVLHSANVATSTNEQCKARSYIIRQLHKNGGFTNSMLCAGYDEAGIDACQGDSGGPLTYTKNGRAYVVGVVSWGIGCGRSNIPGIYSRVSAVRNWIDKQLAISC